MAAALEDDEAPPDLVDVAAMPEQPASIEELTPRVPITLVTGRLLLTLELNVRANLAL